MKGVHAYSQQGSNNEGMLAAVAPPNPGSLPGGDGIWEAFRLSSSWQVKQEAETQEKGHTYVQEQPPECG